MARAEARSEGKAKAKHDAETKAKADVKVVTVANFIKSMVEGKPQPPLEAGEAEVKFTSMALAEVIQEKDGVDAELEVPRAMVERYLGLWSRGT